MRGSALHDFRDQPRPVHPGRRAPAPGRRRASCRCSSCGSAWRASGSRGSSRSPGLRSVLGSADRRTSRRGAEEARRPRQRHPARDVRLRRARLDRGLRGDGRSRASTTSNAERAATPFSSTRWTARRTSTSTARSARSSRSGAARATAPEELLRRGTRAGRGRLHPLRSGDAPRLHLRRARAPLHARSLDRRVPADLATRSGCRARGQGYAVNEGRSGGWPPACARSSSHLKEHDPETGRPYSTRYSGSLVARLPPDPARGRHLPLSARPCRRTSLRASCASSTSATRSRSSPSTRAAAPRPARSGSSTSFRRIAPRAHPLRDRQRGRSRAVRAVQPGRRTAPELNPRRRQSSS